MKAFVPIGLFLASMVLVVTSVRPPEDNRIRPSKPEKGERICIGTHGRMSVPNNREHHYRNLRDRFTNCTYVDGNLELTWLQDESLDLSFLQHIREVTGYVLISHVNVRKIVLPSLQIIRGRTLFKLSVQDTEFALIVTLNKMHNLELPALRDILEGSVGILNNYNLCHIKTIEWKEILTGQNAKYKYVYRFQEPERDCTPCHESCEGGCWGEGAKNCQKFSKISCSPQCHGGRCFGTQPRQCCHLFCAGGCTGPKQSDCLACRNFYDDGVCKQECPPMQRYNPIKYRWERNPDGKYAYGATCVKDCPKHLLKDNGACVRACPPKKKNVNGECVPCDGPCPKICHFSDEGYAIHSGNIKSLQNCTIIEGSIAIVEHTFTEYRVFHEDFTPGPRYGPMDPRELEVLSTVKEITGYLSVQANHPEFKNLDCFRNLEVIGGRQKTEFLASLYIVKSSLVSLNLKSLKRINSGGVAILENKDLCFASKITWSKIIQSQDHSQSIKENKDDKNPDSCIRERHTCDKECSDDGCWGSGNELCLSCRNFQVGEECVSSCEPGLGFFKTGENQCIKCDKECFSTCSGPGPENCDRCKNSKDGPFCVETCPSEKYHDPGTGECMPCHESCVGGCTGPKKTVGPDGCNSCSTAIVRSSPEYMECLKEGDACPEGYFYEWVVPKVDAKLDALVGKALCRPCHPLCKKCDGYGFHNDVCQECISFEQDEQCTTECSSDFYADEKNKKCLPCANECRGCYGPHVSTCHSCKNYKIFVDGDDPYDNATAFNCTQTCPEDYPHKTFPEDGGDPYCSAVPFHKLHQDSPSMLGIIGGPICVVIILFVVLSIVCLWRQKAKFKENATKMAMALTGFEVDEPLKPSNVTPNVNRLKNIKESDLRKGKMLGDGAYGTVYMGFWIPEEAKRYKIPVAIKELKEGTATHCSILEEACIMASLDHPNLLRLIAICMTRQVMLITPLMPKGCLLDYVRHNKEKIGSRTLLNWCTQIARGMAHLEDRRYVHRDLAARNILLQNTNCIKITDFGLAKLLDINEDEYKAEGGKLPIKWLALECIQRRSFSHKSDVWAFGVTVWEILTFGGRPYENIPVKDLPELIEKGMRLPQPKICTTDLFRYLMECWYIKIEDRPNFHKLKEKFAEFAQDPGRYLTIPNDKLMRLPEYTTQDEEALFQNIEGSEMVIAAENYLNLNRIPSSHTLNTPIDTPIQPSTPTQRFFAPDMQIPHASSHQAILRNGSSNQTSRYGSHSVVNSAFNTLGTRSFHYSSNLLSASCDPLKHDEGVSSLPSGLPNGTFSSQTCLAPPPPGKGKLRTGTTRSSTSTRSRPVTVAGLRMEFDDDDYLVPSPQNLFPSSVPPMSTPINNNHCMDLGDGKGPPKSGSSHSQEHTMFPYPPVQEGYFLTDIPSNYGRVPDYHPGLISMDNPEYILNEQRQNKVNYQPLGLPVVKNSSPGIPNVQSHHPTLEHTAIQSAAPNHAFSSLSSSGTSTQYSVPPGPVGLNGVISAPINGPPRTPGANSHPRSSAGEESDEQEYYNDLDRLKHELQPLHPTRTSSSSSSIMALPTGQSKHETTV